MRGKTVYVAVELSEDYYICFGKVAGVYRDKKKAKKVRDDFNKKHRGIVYIEIFTKRIR